MKKTKVLQNAKSLNELANNKRNRFAVIAIDETAYWHEDIQKAAKKIEGVYLINLKEPTHLCELHVSYPAKFLRNVFQDESDEGEAFGWEAFTGEDQYLNGNNKYEYKHIYQYGTEEEILENEIGNPSYC